MRTNITAGRRLFIVVVAGAIVAPLIALVAPWQFAVLVGWNVAALAWLVWVWSTVSSFTPAETRTLATSEDDSRVAAQFLLLGASVASLLGTGFELVKAGQSGGAGRFGLTAIAVTTVIASWAVVHTVYALHYAHSYYADPVGGIDFKTSGEHPDYRDFAYVAFTVGMTFQISDTDIQSRHIRRVVLRHALISYLFGAVILAMTVNVIAGVL